MYYKQYFSDIAYQLAGGLLGIIAALLISLVHAQFFSSGPLKATLMNRTTTIDAVASPDTFVQVAKRAQELLWQSQGGSRQ